MIGRPARALLLAPVAPDADGGGLAKRADLVRRALAQVATVHVVVVAEDRAGSTSRAASGISGWLADPSSRARLGRLAPIDPHTRNASPPAVAALAAQIRADVGASFDLVYALRARTALWAEPFLAAARATILDLDDDEATTFDALADEAERRGAPELAARLRADAASVARLLDEVAPRFQQVAVAGPDDVGAVRRHGNARVVEIPNAVLVPELIGRSDRPTLEPTPCAPARLLLVGDFAYLPNRWAATDLVTAIAPAIRSLGVDVAVDLVGPNPPDALAAAGDPHVVVHGRVDAATLRSLLDRAAVAIAPIAVGGGTRLKILEAWAHGVPVVATPTAAVGLGAVDGEHLLLGADPAALAAAVASCIGRPQEARRRARHGRALVERRHDRTLVVDALASAWHELLT